MGTATSHSSKTIRMLRTRSFLTGLFLLGLLHLGVSPQKTFAQTDTEFWFVAPEVSKSHGWAEAKFYMRFASMNLPARVTISMPANPDFQPIVFEMDANSAHTIEFPKDDATASPYPDIEKIWNYPLNRVNNRGILITSTSLITCYFEVGTFWNPDIFSLKGRNALGKDFYVPFQVQFPNRDYSIIFPGQPIPPPVEFPMYSKIDIVATQDNTEVLIKPTRPVHGNDGTQTIRVELNQGETYSIAPDEIFEGLTIRPGQKPENRLAGTQITSNKPIAVTSTDDSVLGEGYECRDLIGDQIVPTDVIDTQYIVMRGRIGEPDKPLIKESFYVLAVKENTNIFIDGQLMPVVLNPGQTYPYVITQANHFVEATKPVYVYHVGGFGCEMGGALLPPVNECTGSTQVSFTRSKPDLNQEKFFLNIMVRRGAEDGFILNGDGPNTIISADQFQAVPGSAGIWLAATFELPTSVVAPGEGNLIINTKNVFHLGTINGGPGSGTMYGYFSDFSQMRATSMIVGVGTDFEAFCYGQPIQLLATGGTSYTWSPPDFLDNPYSATPIARPDRSMQYVVTATGACDLTDQASITIQVADPLHAMFSVDETEGCSPFTVTIFNESIGVSDYSWSFGPNVHSKTDLETFTHTFYNETDEPVSFDIVLVGRNDIFCVDEMTTRITVYPGVKAEAATEDLEGCAPHDAKFTVIAEDEQELEYLWRFDDGGSSNLKDPEHTFQNFSLETKIFEVDLTVTNSFGCKFNTVMMVRVGPYVEAAFEFNPDPCDPVLLITNSSQGASEYTWNFGDGKEEKDFSDRSFTYEFEHQGPEPIPFTIVLTAASEGCMDVLEREFTLNPPVQSRFEPEQLEVCHGTKVDFTNLSSESAILFRWDLGPELGSFNSEHLERVFENPNEVPKLIEVSLTVETDQGCRSNSFAEIMVFPRIEAEFTSSETEICAPGEVEFFDHSTGGNQYAWDFGIHSHLFVEGSTPINFLVMPPEDKTTVLVTLRVENDYGATICKSEKQRELILFPEVKALVAEVPPDCSPYVVQFENNSEGAIKYTWEFGDGNTASGEIRSHTFINPYYDQAEDFKVHLTAESIYGCKNTLEIPVTVWPKPVADFNLPLEAGCAPLKVEFSGLALGGTPSWFFEGEEEHLSQEYEYEFQNKTELPIIFYPRLVVSNEFGCTASQEHKLTVYPQVEALFEANILKDCHPLEVWLTNLSLRADATTPYLWDYGDGKTSLVTQEQHQYTFNNFSHTKSETFETWLIATSQYGCQDKMMLDFEVFPRPLALFESPDKADCSPLAVEFKDLSIGGLPEKYHWQISDGTVFSAEQNPSHLFNQPPGQGKGVFSVELTVENAYECSASHSRNVEVYPLVTASFEAPDSWCHPLELLIENSSLGATQYLWKVEGYSDTNKKDLQLTLTNFSNTEVKPYRVYLQTSNEFHCYAETEKTIEILPLPATYFTSDKLQDCSPMEVALTNHTPEGSLFSWFLDGELLESPSLLLLNKADKPRDVRVVLQAVNSHKCSKEFSQKLTVFPQVTAAFSTDRFEGCTPFKVPFINLSENANEYTWWFGDQSVSEGVDPRHWFFATGSGPSEYKVILEARSEYGCSDEAEQLLRVHPQPVADFVASPYEQTFPSRSIEITNQSLAGHWNYVWQMGDGSKLEYEQDPVKFPYTYSWPDDDFATRIFTITLQVENNWCQDTISRKVIIRAPQPEAEFLGDLAVCPSTEIQFENKSQYSSAWLWDFGDGNLSTAREPRHAFRDPGVYQVKLLVSGHGGVDSTYQTVTVHQPPVSSFRTDPAVVNIPGSVQMINLSSLGHSWHWDFGDGNTSAEFEPEHFYDQMGQYIITLTVGSDTDPVCYSSSSKDLLAQRSCALHFPNAFRPSTAGPGDGRYIPGDPLNQVFYPIYSDIEEYKLEIYTRWGELIFRTEDLEIGWDGYYRGQLAKMDVYVWKVWAKCFNGQEIIKAGDVTLYR